MRDPLDKLARPGDGEPDAGGGYNRPNQAWQCGNAEHGCPCPFGPTPRGACPELAECQPVQDGDRWLCNRHPRRGGPCDNDPDCDGPTPAGQCGRVHRCTPVRSLRTTQKRVTIAAGVFLAGALAMLLGSRGAATFVAPGPLTNAHARLMSTSDVSRCANCHPGGGPTPANQTLVSHAGAALVGHAGTTQSGLCMECHKQEFNEQHALFAHGLPKGSLAQGSPNAAADDQVACAVCHQEHHGANHNLSALTNHRCQACHKQRFDSFAGAHPDFGQWPYRRRTRIAFDHARHEGIHFAKENASFACSQCHTEGANGAIATLGFEASCASCHDKSIRQSLADGVPMLALPMLDAAAIADAGQQLGPWSQEALGDFDGDLPAPMKLLLAADPAARKAIKQLGADFSFFDFEPASPNDALLAAQLAGSIRKLVAAIAEQGQTEVATRLNGDPAPAAGLPTELVNRLKGEWFGTAQQTTTVPTRRQQTTKHPAGAWFVDPGTLSLRYAAAGHADPVLTAWFNAAAALGDDQDDLRQTALAELNRTGNCLDCHSVEKATNGQLAINWRSLDTTLTTRAFTRFAHTPHLTQPNLADCRHCHQFTPPNSNPVPYTGHNPQAFVSHFEPLRKSACTECHQPKLAGDRCTQCHNYHVEATPTATW